MKYRLIYDNNGQTCNRFWGYLDSVAWAILNKKKVYILYWNPNIKYYNRLRNSPYVSFPLYKEWLAKRFGDKKAQQYVYWIIDNIFFHWLFANISSILGVVEIVRGWLTRNKTDNHLQVGQFVYDQFLPNEDIIAEVNTSFFEIKKEVDIVVGVHIRKGDYKEWHDGKYYYNDDMYEMLMTQMERLLSPRKVKFFLSTNGQVSETITSKHATFRIENGIMAHDLYGLSKCDYIMGPPSTFSKWAALTGHVPLYHIYDVKKNLALSDFSYENSLIPWTL